MLVLSVCGFGGVFVIRICHTGGRLSYMDKDVRVNVRVASSGYSAVVVLAERWGVSVSEVVRVALREFIARQDGS